jgi:acetyl esterase/lipase
VAPEHLVIAGDSAGGGLTLALLQVLRDAGLPLPAGAVAISPWCDLAHSFPSIHTNTDTDIIPRHGLTMHRPSTLWPPPSQELTRTVHSTLRSRIRGLARLDAKGPPGALPAVEHALFEGGIEPPVPGAAEAQAARPPVSGAGEEPTLPADGERVDVGATAPFPTATAASTPHATATSIPSAGPGREPHTIRMRAQDGSTLVIDSQIQLYTPNDLVTHPLVSSAMGYLGGLPPILFLIGDKEVLRDEGIYT